MFQRFVAFLVIICVVLGSSAQPRSPAPPWAPSIDKSWWMSASEPERVAFVRASVDAYIFGYRNAAFLIIGREEHAAEQTHSADASAAYVDAVRIAYTAQWGFFRRPTSFYVAEISKYYKSSPSSDLDKSVTTVMLCLADSPDEYEQPLCGAVRKSAGL